MEKLHEYSIRTNNKKCFIMLCLNTTQQQCIDWGLFAEIARAFKHIQDIEPGDIGFLYNLDSDSLIGAFEATCKPQMNLVPKVWGGKYPSQVRVKPIGVLKHIDNATQIFHAVGVETDELRYEVHLPRFPVHTPAIAHKLLTIIQSCGAELSRKTTELTSSNAENEITQKLRGRIPKGLEKILNDVVSQEREKADKKVQMVVKELRDNYGVEPKSLAQEIRILVLGPAGIDQNILYGIAKSLSLREDQLEFHLDYEKNKRFDIESLRFSTHYSGLLVGPIAHKTVGVGDYDCLIKKLRQEEGFPVFEELRTKKGELKITKTSFRESLKKILERISDQH